MSINNIIKLKRSYCKNSVCLNIITVLCFFGLSVPVSAGSLSNLSHPYPDSYAITRNEYSYNIDMEVPDNLVCLFVDKYNELKKSKQLLPERPVPEQLIVEYVEGLKKLQFSYRGMKHKFRYRAEKYETCQPIRWAEIHSILFGLQHDSIDQYFNSDLFGGHPDGSFRRVYGPIRFAITLMEKVKKLGRSSSNDNEIDTEKKPGGPVGVLKTKRVGKMLTRENAKEIDSEFRAYTNERLVIDTKPSQKESTRLLLDKVPQTAWIGEREGAGEFFHVYSASGFNVLCIYFSNGNTKSFADWARYARVKTLAMYINGYRVIDFELEDSMELQVVYVADICAYLDKNSCYGVLGIRKSDHLSFEIVDIYPGTSSQKPAISDLFVIEFIP